MKKKILVHYCDHNRLYQMYQKNKKLLTGQGKKIETGIKMSKVKASLHFCPQTKHWVTVFSQALNIVDNHMLPQFDMSSKVHYLHKFSGTRF